MKRRATRQIQVGTVPIGGDAPIGVQSMATTYTRDVQATVAQIHRLEEVGCELVRIACPEEVDVQALRSIKRQHLFIGASCHLPVIEGSLELGQWQRIFLVELDRTRTR